MWRSERTSYFEKGKQREWGNVFMKGVKTRDFGILPTVFFNKGFATTLNPILQSDKLSSRDRPCWEMESNVWDQLKHTIIQKASVAVCWVVTSCGLRRWGTTDSIYKSNRPDDGRTKHFWNIGKLLWDYTVKIPRTVMYILKYLLQCHIQFRFLDFFHFLSPSSAKRPANFIFPESKIFHISLQVNKNLIS